MLLPEYLREFIILHELCHTRHHNHSTQFHKLLNSLIVNKEKEYNNELKTYRIPRVIK
jgi:predicted metal-dependent hydrolase